MEDPPNLHHELRRTPDQITLTELRERLVKLPRAVVRVSPADAVRKERDSQ
jgi:hypothetical protein